MSYNLHQLPAHPCLEEVVRSHPVVQEALRLFGGRTISVRRCDQAPAEEAHPGQERDMQQQSLWSAAPERQAGDSGRLAGPGW